MAGRLALLIFFLLSLFATAQKVTNPPDCRAGPQATNQFLKLTAMVKKTAPSGEHRASIKIQNLVTTKHQI
jgi:hypothetical protein